MELCRSAIDFDYIEIRNNGMVVKEIFIPFQIKRIPKSFESIEAVEKWLRETEWKLARFSAYRWLAMRNIPSRALRKKLEQKNYSEDVCNRVIEELERLGYLKDDEYLESAIRRDFRKGYGPRWIEMKLRSQGLSETGVRKWITPEMQREKIRAWALKCKSKKKAVAVLQRRGFDAELIIQELKFSLTAR